MQPGQATPSTAGSPSRHRWPGCCWPSTYAEAAVDTVQLHGGIGFTWEHDAHLYYKNGLSNKVLLGGPGDQLDRLADSLGI